MADEVGAWLHENDLSELVDRFERERVSSFRLRMLDEDLVKELVPEIGLRRPFEKCLKDLRSKGSTSKGTVDNTAGNAHSDNNPIVIVIDQTEADILSGANTCEPKIDPLAEPIEDLIDEGISCSLVPSQSSVTSAGGSETDCESLLSDFIPPRYKRKHDEADDDFSDTDTSKPSTSKRVLRKQEQSHLSPCIAAAAGLKYLQNLDLREILIKHNIKTETAVLRFEQEGYLLPGDRHAISQVVASELLRHNYKPTALEYKEAANKIIQLFPSEAFDLYYIAPSKIQKFHGGYLGHRVKNSKSTAKKLSCSSSKSRIGLSSQLQPCASGTADASILNGCCDRNDPEVQRAVLCLKHESRDAWPEILRSWSVTHPMRHKSLIDSRPSGQPTKEGCDESNLVDEYLREWDVLQLPAGYLLLDQDFAELYPNHSDGLLSKWDLLKDHIIDLLKQEKGKKVEEFSQQLLDLYDATPVGKRDVILFHLLPSLCVKRGRGGGKASRDVPSIQEARRAFILHVTIPGELNRAVRNRRHLLQSFGLRLQPLLIVVGPTLAEITASYVQLDAVRYNLRTPLKALDTCFKAFFTVDAAYPQACRAVWTFVQQFFYGLHLQEEKFPRVKSVTSTLQGMVSRRK